MDPRLAPPPRASKTRRARASIGGVEFGASRLCQPWIPSTGYTVDAAQLGRGAGGQGAALLVARRRLAARHSRLPMPTLCAGALACGGLHLADAGSARQGGHGSRWVLLSPATAAAAAVATGQGRSAPGPPAPCLSLIGRPSESSPCQHSRPPRPAWLRADPLSRSLEKLSGKRTLS